MNLLSKKVVSTSYSKLNETSTEKWNVDEISGAICLMAAKQWNVLLEKNLVHL